MVLVATQVKRRRGTTAENDAFTGAEGEITVDTEKHELRVHDGVTQGGFKIGGGSGSGRNIGDTFMTKRTDTNLAGAVECDGATYNTTDFTGTGSIGELLEAGKLDYVSLSAYSTAIAQTGWCDKIGWDGAGNTAFRVPTLNAHIVQTNNIPVVGNGMTLGLTDGTHNGGMISSPAFGSGGIGVRDECYGTQAGSSNYGSYSFGNTTTGLTTDPTKSGIIADTSDTAQLRVMIQIANGATDQALETCTGVLADVAGLKDMSNITATGKETAVGWMIPDYTAGVSRTSGVDYTAESNGFLCLVIGSQTNTSFLYINNVSIKVSDATIAGSFYHTALFPVAKGDVYRFEKFNNTSAITLTFYPCRTI